MDSKYYSELKGKPERLRGNEYFSKLMTHAGLWAELYGAIN